MIAALMSLVRGFRPPPIVIALCAFAILGGIIWAQWRGSVASAATIAQLKRNLSGARADNAQLLAANSRLAEANLANAQSAERFGRGIATLDAVTREALDRIDHAPPTTACLDVPVIRDALERMRALRAARAASPPAAMPSRDTGGIAEANRRARPDGER